jgi:NitT/TauT family transport system ATP-binding protein
LLPLPWERAGERVIASAVEFDQITCTFAARGGAGSYTAVKDVNLAVAAGEFVSVVGPTGCGKSTLLNVAAGLLRPSSGTTRVFGEPLTGINRKAGYMFQSEALMPWRTALAQMLILDPQILLMDEPFSALDIQTRQLMENELLELWNADRKSVIFITHDLEEAIALSDRVVVLSAGPATHPIGEFAIDLPRPRDVAEIRLSPRFIELHDRIWHTMKEEVLKGYAQTRNRVAGGGK